MVKGCVTIDCRLFSLYYKTYKLTYYDVDAMVRKQNGRCKICGGNDGRGLWGLVVDHDHITGQVRQMLCTKCNLLLGNQEAGRAR